MKIQLKLFASLREALGQSIEDFELPEPIQTMQELKDWLGQRNERWHRVLIESKNIRVAMDQEMVEWNSIIKNNAEVAFFPPVTGG